MELVNVIGLVWKLSLKNIFKKDLHYKKLRKYVNVRMNQENLEEKKIENSINQASKIARSSKRIAKAKIILKPGKLYDYCPLCKSKNITKSMVGNCREHHLYNPKIPPLMQWMNCVETVIINLSDGYL